jgi:hypothetical protein
LGPINIFSNNCLINSRLAISSDNFNLLLLIYSNLLFQSCYLWIKYIFTKISVVFIVQILCYIRNNLLLFMFYFDRYCYYSRFFFNCAYFFMKISLAYLFLFNVCNIRSVSFRILFIAGLIS